MGTEYQKTIRASTLFGALFALLEMCPSKSEEDYNDLLSDTLSEKNGMPK